MCRAGSVLIATVAFLATGGYSHHSAPQTEAQIEGTDTTAARMVALGADHAESFLKHSQTEGIRNMLGGARGVFIAPSITGGAALIGYESGTGFLLRRHGKDWSDPVFFTLSGTSAGWQIGGKEERGPHPAHDGRRRG
jgi:lipid-binding SYLF domain-containing protein